MGIKKIVRKVICAYRSFYFTNNMDLALSRWQKLSVAYATSAILLCGYSTYVILSSDFMKIKRHAIEGGTTLKIKYDISNNKLEKTVYHPQEKSEEESVSISDYK